MKPFGKPLLCSDCFHNHGLQLRSISIGFRDNKKCLQCGSFDGVKLNKEHLVNLLVDFFQEGTRYNETPMEPVLVAMKYHPEFDDDIDLEPVIKRDLDLLRSKVNTHMVIYNAPRTMNLGFTEYADSFNELNVRDELNSKLKKHIDDLISGCELITLKAGTIIYRIRTEVKDLENPEEFDSPPFRFRSHTRVARANLPILYCSPKIETSFFEIKAEISTPMLLITYEVLKDLRIINLDNAYNRKLGEETGFDYGDYSHFLNAEFLSRDYLKTQLISERIAQKRFDGIQYLSYFTKVMSAREYNIALYGYPLDKKKLKIRSINNFIPTELKVKYCLGPVLHT